MPPTKPYQDLYIYLIQGPVSGEDEVIFGEGYLGNWVEDDCSFLFFSEPRPEVIQQLLKRTPFLTWLEDYHFTYEEWQGGGLDPFRIERFVIMPPWHPNFEVEPGETQILLDPGVVFGTGLHPTTRDCLRALAYLFRNEIIESVIDLGTGTGILSLAAAYLGAERVLAVDLNPLCVRTAQKNVSLNQLDGLVEVVEGDAGRIAEGGADLILANIHHEVMVQVLEKGIVQKTRWFVLSGLMRTQAGEIKERLKKCGLAPVKEWDHEMTWYTILARG